MGHMASRPKLPRPLARPLGVAGRKKFGVFSFSYRLITPPIFIKIGDGDFHVCTAACYRNMAFYGKHGCRIGQGPAPNRPYSGITCVIDFCAHAQEDITNMIGGCTSIVTLTKPEMHFT